MPLESKVLRLMNKDQVIAVLRQNSDMTKKELQKATSLSLSSINNILNELIDEHIVKICNKTISTGGRKSQTYSLVKNQTLIFVMNIFKEGTINHLEGEVFDFNGESIYSSKRTYESLTLTHLLHFIDRVTLMHSSIKAIAISIPLIVHKGKVMSCEEGLEYFMNQDVVKLIEKHFSIPVIIENDVNTAALSFQIPECAFIYQPPTSLALPGMALMIDGKLIQGSTHFAGEVSYLPFYDMEEQYALVKSQKGTIELLSMIVQTVIAMINPSQIVICNQYLKDTLDIEKSLKNRIDEKHMPSFLLIDQINPYIMSGLKILAFQLLNYIH